MRFKKIFILLFINSIFCTGQISNFNEKYQLPNEVSETSGLLFLNSKIITHNDSGDNANLYELDSLSGNLLRTISITNATNIDWEDITEDETHIYIADIGNNNGNRTDLKIYKILKSDYLSNNAVSAEIISFSYEDQTDFSTQTNSSNFDAEAIVIYQNNILIFSKNWADLKTNVYKIPKTIGNHTADKISSADIEGLITGAVYNDDRFFLTGYNTSLIPFLIYISFNRMPGDDIFSSGFEKYSLENNLGQGSQIEGITHFGNGKYYISREKFTTTVSGNDIIFPQKLYEFYDETHSSLSIEVNELTHITISPNPTKDKLNVNYPFPITKISVYNLLGKRVENNIIINGKEIDISKLTEGSYFFKIKFSNDKVATSKIIKF